jgi:hypothetical protein
MSDLRSSDIFRDTLIPTKCHPPSTTRASISGSTEQQLSLASGALAIDRVDRAVAVSRPSLHPEKHRKSLGELCTVRAHSINQRNRLGVILAGRVLTQRDAANDICRSDPRMDAQRDLGVSDLTLVIGELASDVGGLPELLGLA